MDRSCQELIEAVGKVIRVVGVTVNEAVGVPRPMTIMPAPVVHGRDSDVRTNISAEGTGSPGNPDSRGWRRIGSRVGDRDAQAYRMPGNGEAPIFWSRLQTPDSEKKRPARCAESQNCLSRQTLRFNQQSIYEGKHVGAVLAGLFMIRKRSIVQFASRSKSHYRGRYCTLRFN